MNRLAENFSLDGQAISRKFLHLTSLLKHYDPEFYLYLYENGAHELLFCYRWILLDLKREFPFEDTLEMLEVLWASIPPTTSAYQNLFDDGHLYIPNRSKVKPSVSPLETSLEVKPKHRRSDQKTSVSKPVNKRIRSIKFLPNVLSTDSQVLDSPVMSDNEESEPSEKSCENKHNFVVTMPWDSPDLSSKKKRFHFDQPSLGSSNIDSFGSVSNECYEATLLNEPFFDDIEEDESIFSEYRKVARNGSTSKSQTDEVSSCSTFDSGIQRSNTLSSVVQGKLNCLIVL